MSSPFLPTAGVGADPQWDGLYAAKVAIVTDPLGQGRVQLIIPQVLGTGISNWALPMQPGIVPAVGSTCLAIFLGGNINAPYYFVGVSNTLIEAISSPTGLLNSNPLFIGGVTTGWTATGGTLAGTQPNPDTSPPYTYGALWTASGTGGGYVTEATAPFTSVVGQPYQVQAWVYYPAGGNVNIGFGWTGHANTTATVSVAAGTWSLLTTVQTATATTGWPIVGPATSTAGELFTAEGIIVTGQLPGQIISAGSISQGQVNFTARQIGGIATTIAASAPSGALAGDLWFDSAAGYQLYQYSGTAWNLYQFGTGAIATGSITAALIAANTITAAKLAAGIVYAGIVDATTITGSTLQNSTGNPKTSINPDGSLSLTNSAGVIIFNLGPDGTMYWYNSVGQLLMELQPGGNTLIYESNTGPTFWDFEGSTDSWASVHSTLASSSAWSPTGNDSLLITHSGTTQPWGATSPSFLVVAGTTASMTCFFRSTAAITGVSVLFTFWSNTSGGGTNLGSVTGDQGVFTSVANQVYTLTITGAAVPTGAQSATFTLQSTKTTASVTMAIDSVNIAGGLVYSLSPTGGTDAYGNPFEQGLNFVGLPGLTNVFGIEDAYGNQLMSIDGSGNISGASISSSTDVKLGGQSVSTALNAAPGGILSLGWIPYQTSPNTGYPNTPIAVGVQTGVLALTVTLTAGRAYRVSVPSFRLKGSLATGYCKVQVVGASGTSATVSSPTYSEHFVVFDTSAANERFSPQIEFFINSASNQTMTFMLVLTPGFSTTTAYILNPDSGTAGGPLGTGEPCASIAVEDLGIYGSGADYDGFNDGQVVDVTGGGGGGGHGTTTSKFYGAQSWSYSGGGTQRDYNNSMYTSESSGNPGGWGVQYSYMDFSAVGSVIPGTATVNWATFRLYCLHSWYNAGLTVALYTATSLNSFGTLSGVLEQWTMGEGAILTHTITNASVLSNLIGSAIYLVIGSNPWGTNSLEYYGYFWGCGDGNTSNDPLLTVNWTS